MPNFVSSNSELCVLDHLREEIAIDEIDQPAYSNAKLLYRPRDNCRLATVHTEGACLSTPYSFFKSAEPEVHAHVDA
jgi:hypothetical protein